MPRSCNCGGKTIKVGQVKPRAVAIRKVPTKNVSQASKIASQKATKVALKKVATTKNPFSKGCNC